MTPKEYWDNTNLHIKFKFVKGLHIGSYAMKYKDLLPKEKAIVRKYVKSLEE